MNKTTKASISAQRPDPNHLSDLLETESQLPARAIDLGMTMCHCCGLLNHVPTPEYIAAEEVKLRCQRCRSPLHLRKTDSLQRTLAFLIAASILYIPANVLPMTITESLLGRQQDTIMSGVIYFWQSGDYFVSSVIFMASIFIPLLKLIILALLLIVVRLQAAKRMTFSPKSCAVLYRVVEFIGRWSMIDVFVVAMLAALIQIQSLATILAGTGAVAFGAVVVLTMFAALSFDPRIIWDNYAAAQNEDQPHANNAFPADDQATTTVHAHDRQHFNFASLGMNLNHSNIGQALTAYLPIYQHRLHWKLPEMFQDVFEKLTIHHIEPVSVVRQAAMQNLLHRTCTAKPLNLLDKEQE